MQWGVTSLFSMQFLHQNLPVSDAMAMQRANPHAITLDFAFLLHFSSISSFSSMASYTLKSSNLRSFKDALTSPAGRKKLIDSMEGILQGTQQKLEKVQIALQSEQKAHEALKGKYAAAVSEQRHYNSILKAFQVECARNERIRMQSSQDHLTS
ncbi:hypothetical protein HAX54_036323 [Datura stramonium]|uniref:CCDC93 coiled-coil domain-containing protein n=1 Tax=Datura stramonium TaxID=4076 RepID=A0ABS8VHX7_DATST|nr:hypothetical protein [Datura stramonium]